MGGFQKRSGKSDSAEITKRERKKLFERETSIKLRKVKKKNKKKTKEGPSGLVGFLKL